MAELRHWHGVCLIIHMRRIGRLFTIKTRFEAWVIIYAIALGAVERGKAYLGMYPGALGWTLALCCTGVVFLAGAKLLDSVRPAPVAARAAIPAASMTRRRKVSRNRPRLRPLHSGSEPPLSLRKD